MGTSPHETNGNHMNRGDLMQIRGIGVARKRWLNSLGIDTIADLAQAEADVIEAQAKRNGRALSRDEIEDWIAQAQVQQAQALPKQAEFIPVVAAIAPEGDPKLAASEEPTAASEADATAWEAVASFKVTYQTRHVSGKLEKRLVAHHLETNDVAHWGDFATELMPQWLRDRVALARPRWHAKTPIAAHITQLRVMQPPYMRFPMVADKTVPIFHDSIHTTEPFALEVSMHFAGLTESCPEEQVTYRVQCLARNLATGATHNIGDVTANVSLANDSTYKVLLPSLRLPEAGSYRLQVLAMLQDAPATFGRFKVPLLQVV